MITTRFAPSPSGALHIGGARTALFNYLFARKMKQDGLFRLRIEDTDKERSSQTALSNILNSLQWLGLDWDGDIIYQSRNLKRHQEIVQELLAQGKAYYCLCSKERLEKKRAQALAQKRSPHYDGHCRQAGLARGVVRIKAPLEGEIKISDKVQGDIIIQNSQIDDFIIQREDGSTTYMLSVVVDDYDMNISHVIRGVDHLTNMARQYIIYRAMDWQAPIFAHIPLIHDQKGRKLSKRSGGEDIEFYQDQGYLPEAMCNYLARLGWAHGNDEIFSLEDAIKWFSLEKIGQSPARFNLDKLTFLNHHYIAHSPPETLWQWAMADIPSAQNSEDREDKERFFPFLRGLAQHAKTLTDFTKNARFLFIAPLGVKLESGSKRKLHQLRAHLDKIDWQTDEIEKAIRGFATRQDIKLKNIAQPLRLALMGLKNAPNLFEAMTILGREETYQRIQRIEDE